MLKLWTLCHLLIVTQLCKTKIFLLYVKCSRDSRYYCQRLRVSVYLTTSGWWAALRWAIPRWFYNRNNHERSNWTLSQLGFNNRHNFAMTSNQLICNLSRLFKDKFRTLFTLLSAWFITTILIIYLCSYNTREME